MDRICGFVLRLPNGFERARLPAAPSQPEKPRALASEGTPCAAKTSMTRVLVSAQLTRCGKSQPFPLPSKYGSISPLAQPKPSGESYEHHCSNGSQGQARSVFIKSPGDRH